MEECHFFIKKRVENNHMSQEVELTCPTCQIFKKINIPVAIFLQKKFGTIKIQVPPGAVCREHQFIAFVDTKGIVRGYERIDLLMSLPTEEIKESDKDKELTLKTIIRKYGLYGVFSLLHAKIFDYPAYIIKDKGSEETPIKLNEFLDKNLPEKYRAQTFKIKFLDEISYDKIRVKEKNALLIDAQQNILQTPWEEKLKFEESMLKKALVIIDDHEQLIIIQQDIANFIKEAELAINILERVKEIYKEDLIDEISSQLRMPKINKSRLNLIKDFIGQRYSEKLAKRIKNKVQEFLNLL